MTDVKAEIDRLKQAIEDDRWLSENYWRIGKAGRRDHHEIQDGRRAKIAALEASCQPLGVEPPVMSDNHDSTEAAYETARANHDKRLADERRAQSNNIGTVTVQLAPAEVNEVDRAIGKVDDPVRPKHYQGDLVMRIIEHFGLETDFYLANLVKYVLRHKNKAGIEDLRKGAWYLQRAIERLEGKHTDGVR